MQTCGIFNKATIAAMFCLSLMVFSMKAQSAENRVVDTAHVLQEKTHQYLSAMLSHAAKEHRADIIVLITNQAIQNKTELFNNMLKTGEVKFIPTISPTKRAYLIINTYTHQGHIVLGKEVILDDSLQYGLAEIQAKILAQDLIKHDVNAVALLATQAMIGSFEDWPAPVPASFFSRSSMTFFKWVGMFSLLGGLLYGLRRLFYQPHWQELPISHESTLWLNDLQSLGLTYSRTHH